MARAAKEVHEFSPDSVGRVLGVQWNVFEDSFFFDANAPAQTRLNKRIMLKIVN